MRTVDAEESRTTSTSTFCRPIRSASGPKNSPPSGRTTNPAAKIANVDSSAAVGSPLAKKFAARIVDRVP